MKIPKKLFDIFLLSYFYWNDAFSRIESRDWNCVKRLFVVDPLKALNYNCIVITPDKLHKVAVVNRGRDQIPWDNTDHTKVFPKTETDPINEILLFLMSRGPRLRAGSQNYSWINRSACKKIMIEAMVGNIISGTWWIGCTMDFNPGQASNGNFINQKLDGANDNLV